MSTSTWDVVTAAAAALFNKAAAYTSRVFGPMISGVQRFVPFDDLREVAGQVVQRAAISAAEDVGNRLAQEIIDSSSRIGGRLGDRLALHISPPFPRLREDIMVCFSPLACVHREIRTADNLVLCLECGRVVCHRCRAPHVQSCLDLLGLRGAGSL